MMDKLVLNGEIVRLYDTAEGIQTCLNCPLPECVNCSGNAYKRNYKLKKAEERREKAREMAKRGMTNKDIAAALGTSPASVSRWFGAKKKGPKGAWGETRKQVLELHAKGLPQAEIARRLGISPTAVCEHLKKGGAKNEQNS